MVDSINSSDNKLYSDSKHNNGIMVYNQISVPARMNFPNGQLSNRSTTPLFRRLEKPTPNLIDLMLEDSSQIEEIANDF